MARELLRVNTTRSGRQAVVSAAGEIDLNTVDAWSDRIDDACRARPAPDRLVLDVTGVEFISSTGLSVLVHAHRFCEDNGISLLLVAATPAVHRAVTATGLDKVIPMVDLRSSLD